MNESEIKEMEAIFSEYLEKKQGYEAQIRETYEHVAKWAKDPDMQVSTLGIAVHSFSCNGFYSYKAAELVRELIDLIKARRKEARDVAYSPQKSASNV